MDINYFVFIGVSVFILICILCLLFLLVTTHLRMHEIEKKIDIILQRTQDGTYL